MTYKVLKKGRGPIYGNRATEVVASGLTWQEAHGKVFALHGQCSASWDIWFTHE
jgi:hypothetical protein